MSPPSDNNSKRRLFRLLRRGARTGSVGGRSAVEESALWTAHQRAATAVRDSGEAAQRIASHVAKQRGTVDGLADRARAVSARAQDLSIELRSHRRFVCASRARRAQCGARRRAHGRRRSAGARARLRRGPRASHARLGGVARALDDARRDRQRAPPGQREPRSDARDCGRGRARSGARGRRVGRCGARARRHGRSPPQDDGQRSRRPHAPSPRPPIMRARSSRRSARSAARSRRRSSSARCVPSSSRSRACSKARTKSTDLRGDEPHVAARSRAHAPPHDGARAPSRGARGECRQA